MHVGHLTGWRDYTPAIFKDDDAPVQPPAPAAERYLKGPRPRGSVRAEVGFRRCTVCRHEGVLRDGACGLCGGETVSRDAPPDLFDGWRCACWHCLWRPC